MIVKMNDFWLMQMLQSRLAERQRGPIRIGQDSAIRISSVDGGDSRVVSVGVHGRGHRGCRRARLNSRLNFFGVTNG